MAEEALVNYCSQKKKKEFENIVVLISGRQEFSTSGYLLNYYEENELQERGGSREEGFLRVELTWKSWSS